MEIEPPGPKKRPIVGNAQRYSENPLSFIQSLTRSYNGVCTFSLGPEKTYLVPNPDEIERVLVTEDAKYQKSETIRTGGIDDLLGDGLLMSNGELWEQQRELAQPALSPGRMAKFGETISGYGREIANRWDEGATVEIDSLMAHATVKIIVDIMFGTDLRDETAEQIQTDIEPIGMMFKPDPVQFLLPEWVPTPDRIEFQRAVDSLDSILDDLVKQRKGTEEGEMDLLSILLRAQGQDTITNDLLRDELMTILLAGHDTTALALTYAWFLISENPSAEEKLHAEVDDVLGGKLATAEDVRELDYTEHIIQEAMRLYPPVYTIFREPTEDVTIGGYSIDEGSLVMLPQWGVHHDPRWYDNPEEFEPDRWTTERVKNRPTYSYFPFGGGPRHCIGKHLAMLEAQLILATIAQDYTLERAADGPLDLLPSLTIHPEERLEMIPRKR